MKKIMTILAAFLILGANAMAQEQAGFEPKKGSMGIGFGIPYGVIGTNYDYSIAPNLSASMGLGTTIFAGMGYNFGMKYFLASAESGFRPKFSLYYGTNAMVLDASGDEGQSFSGLTLGFGSQIMWGKSKSNGLDFDIMYIASSGYDMAKLRAQGYDASEPGSVKIAIGYRHAF